MIDRSTFYSSGMTGQEKLSLLLAVGRLDSSSAAEIAHVAKGTMDVYRSPRSGRPVPDRILLVLEKKVFERLKRDAKAAGYTLKKAA